MSHFYPPPLPPSGGPDVFVTLLRWTADPGSVAGGETHYQSAFYYRLSGTISPSVTGTDLAVGVAFALANAVHFLISHLTVFAGYQFYWQDSTGIHARYLQQSVQGFRPEPPSPGYACILFNKFTSSVEADRPGRFWCPSANFWRNEGETVPTSVRLAIRNAANTFGVPLVLGTFSLTPAIFYPTTGSLVDIDHFRGLLHCCYLTRRNARKRQTKLPFNWWAQV